MLRRWLPEPFRAGLGPALGEQIAPQPTFFHVRAYMPAIVFVYAVALRTSFEYERAEAAASVAPVPGEMTLRRALIGYGLAPPTWR